MISCSMCSKKFKAKWVLNQHLKRHTNEKPHKCNICGKEFATSSELNRHIRIHTGERPYNCHLCNVSFKQASARNQHLRTHFEEKSFCCLFCNSSFKRKFVLEQHIRLHLQERFYHCSSCPKAFQTSQQLRDHRTRSRGSNKTVLRHHCIFCDSNFFSEKGLMDRTIFLDTFKKSLTLVIIVKRILWLHLKDGDMFVAIMLLIMNNGKINNLHHGYLLLLYGT